MLILAIASHYDVREHRIPNWLVFTGIVTGLCLTSPEAGGGGEGLGVLQGMMAFAGRFSAVTAVFFLLFVCRMIGAGDIKTAALIFGYLGFGTGFKAVAGGFIIGAFWSLFLMAVKGSTFQRLSYFLSYLRSLFQTKKITAYYSSSRDGYDAVIPLGFCMFLGTLLAVILV